MKWSLVVGVALAGLVAVHQSALVPRSRRVRRGGLASLFDPGAFHVFDGQVPGWARLLHPSRVWLRWRGRPRGPMAARILCDPSEVPLAERFVRDEGWLSDVCPTGTPPAGGPTVELFMGRLPARTGGEVYDVEVARELMRRGCQVEYHWASLPFRTPWRRGLSLVDQHFLDRVKPGRPLVVVVHHVERAVDLRGADLVVAVSEATARGLGVPAVRIPPGFHPLGVASEPRERAREFLFVGTLTPRKGVDHLLRAWARLPRGAAHLRVVGGSDGDYRRRVLEPLAGGLDVGFEGRVSRGRLAELYATSDVLVLPSLQEGFGIVALEAMSCGLAVVASRVDSLPDLVGPAGLLVPPADPGALAEALQRLLETPGLRARLGDIGRRRASEWSWEATRQRFWEAVEPLL